jgi:hypothetical protein
LKKLYKMQHLECSGTPVPYIEDARFLKINNIRYATNPYALANTKPIQLL